MTNPLRDYRRTETVERRRGYARDLRARARTYVSVGSLLILIGGLGLLFTPYTAPVVGMGAGLLASSLAPRHYARKWDRLAETPEVTP